MIYAYLYRTVDSVTSAYRFLYLILDSKIELENIEIFHNSIQHFFFNYLLSKILSPKNEEGGDHYVATRRHCRVPHTTSSVGAKNLKND